MIADQTGDIMVANLRLVASGVAVLRPLSKTHYPLAA